MKRLVTSLLAGALLTTSFGVSPAFAQSDEDQSKARKEMKAGRELTAMQIQRKVVPQMKGMEYMTFEYDGVAKAYRFKFIKQGRVVFVDVDARSGNIIRQTR